MDGGVVPRLRLLGELMVTALQRAEADQALQTALSEVNQLRDRLEHENVYLRSEVAHGKSTSLVTGRGPAIEQTLALAQQVAPTDATVLILGETGTGKELIARAIHNGWRRRKARAMIKVNCAALPAALIETELFGRERGPTPGRTPADRPLRGRRGVTIFLDEIADSPRAAGGSFCASFRKGSSNGWGAPRRRWTCGSSPRPTGTWPGREPACFVRISSTG